MPDSAGPLFQTPDYEAGRRAADERAQARARQRELEEQERRAADEARAAARAEAQAAAPTAAPAPETSAASAPTEDPSAAVVPEEPAPLAPLLTLRDGLPDIVDTPEALADAVAALARATGPVALDAERASGYRYSGRAYLIQLRREGAGTFLVDPIAFGSELPTLATALGDAEWLLHAATQDLACLREVGLEPQALFDSELAGRLLGYPRVGLATLTEELLGQRMRKEHSAADWSTRPLPAPWLEYAALDVEILIELQEVLTAELIAAGKDEWARQEFEYLLTWEPAVRSEPWRRVSGLHKLRSRRGTAAARALWEARDEIAQERDTTPSRIIPDGAIVAAAGALSTSRNALLNVRGFNGRGAERYVSRWLEAIAGALDLPESELPSKGARGQGGPPQPRLWAEKDVAAGERWTVGRESLTELAESLNVPIENLLTPDHLRRVLWQPPTTRDLPELVAEIGEQLRGYGAREWQIQLTSEPLAAAILAGDAVA